MKKTVIIMMALSLAMVYTIAYFRPNTTPVEDHIIEWVYLEEMVTYEQAEEEIDQLARLLIKTHPILKGDSKRASEVNEALHAIYEDHQEGIRIGDYYFEIQRVLATLGDGHTRAWMPMAFDRLPYEIDIEGCMVEISAGGYREYVITAINDMPIDTLLPVIREHIPSDTIDFQDHLLEDCLLSREYVQYFMDSTSPEVVLTLEKDGQAVEVTTQYDDVTISPEEKVNYSFSVDENDKIGWMDLNRILITKSFREDVAIFFEEVKEAEIGVLVIDLRGNPGGYIEGGLEIIKHLGVEEINFYEDAHFNTDMMKIVPAECPFDGDVYCLIDSGTYSSAANFATLLKLNDLATLVGEPTGGSPNHYGYPVELVLQDSGIVCTISTAYISFDEIQGVQPLEPDIPMETFEEMLLPGRKN